ncbi:MAG: hypothetical protein MJA32_13060, partial [Proteobacteria bacterium]|nr:hypothetical protein [Pseudomonadota bacterium]
MPGDESHDHEGSSPTALADRIRAGGSRAEAEFVRRYSRWIQAVLLKRCGDPEQAQDLAQRSLLTVLLRLRTRRLDDSTKLDRF